MTTADQIASTIQGRQLGSRGTNVKAVKNPADLGQPDHEGWRFWRLFGTTLAAPYVSGGVFPWPATSTAIAGCKHTPDGIGPDCRCGITVGPTLVGLAEYKIALWDFWRLFPVQSEYNKHFTLEDIAVGRLDTWDPAYPIRNKKWHMEHPYSSEDGEFFRVTAGQIRELWVPGNVDERTAQKIANRHDATVHMSARTGKDWMQELAPKANPRRFGCWICGENEYPFCLRHVHHAQRWLALYTREVVTEMAETYRKGP